MPSTGRWTALVTLLLGGCSLGEIGGDQARRPLPPSPTALGAERGEVASGASELGDDPAPSPPTPSDLADAAAPGDGASGADMPPVPGVRDLTSDRNQFFGASRCAQANVALCEDFESGAVDTNVWQVVGTTPVVDGVQKARGGKALHITQHGNGVSFLRETKTFPAPNNDYFGRAFYYFAKMPSPPGMTFSHWTIVAGSGTNVTGEIRVGGFLQNGQLTFGVGTDSGGAADGTGDWTTLDDDPKGNPEAIPLNQWVCVEWSHKGSTNETRFYWDAVEHGSLHTTPTVNGGNGKPYYLPTFDEVWIGWAEYQTSSQTFEMWVDEIAIDGDRVGCVL
jgi:hypothetical protein